MFQEFLIHNWGTFAAIGAMCFPAIVSTMPKPGTWQGGATVYAWLYSFMQEVLAIRSSKLSAGSEPQIATNIPASTVSGGDEQPATFPAKPTK